MNGLRWRRRLYAVRSRWGLAELVQWYRGLPRLLKPKGHPIQFRDLHQ